MRQKMIISALALIALLFSTMQSFATVEWNVSLWGKPRIFTQHIEKLSKLVEEKTKGKFKIKLHYGETLSKSNENLDGISIGAFEMAQFCTEDHIDKIPTLTVLDLPFLGIKSIEEQIRVSLAVYKNASVKKDLSRWKAMLLMPTPLPQYNIAGVGPPPKTIIEYGNLDIRATNDLGKAFERIGAIPKALEPTQIVNSLDNNVIKAVAFAEHAHLFYKTLDRAEWWTANLNPGSVNCPVIVNQAAYDKLSKEHRRALTGSVLHALAFYTQKYTDNYLKKFEKTIAEKKIKKIIYPEEELKTFIDRIAIPARDEWIKSMKSKGLPGQQLYDIITKTLESKIEKPLFQGIVLNSKTENAEKIKHVAKIKKVRKKRVRKRIAKRKPKKKTKPKVQFFPEDF